jgi:hypothetical protein
VSWGDGNVLHAEHLDHAQEFCLGEAADFALGEEALGEPRWTLVRRDGEQTWVVVPHGASCEVQRSGADVSAEQLAAHGLSRTSRELAGAHEVRIEADVALRIRHGALSFVVRDLPAERIAMPGVIASLDKDTQKWTLASLGGQALLLLALQFFVPPSVVRSVDVVNTRSRLVQYAIEANAPPAPPPVASTDDGKRGKAAEGDVGKIGRPRPDRDCKTCGARAKPSTPARSRDELKEAAMREGIVGILQSVAAGVTNADSRYTASSVVSGSDAENMLALFGPNVGEARGVFGGLGAVGSGHGGGGDGKGTIGVGRLGTVGGSDGDGRYASAAGRLAGRGSRVPRISSPTAEITGSLSKETVRRTIGLHVAEVRHCYTQALTSRPELQGRVVVQFVISPSGAVSRAVVKDSSLGDPRTAQCIADVVGRIDFPAPQGGLVVVSYPFVLSQVK